VRLPVNLKRVRLTYSTRIIFSAIAAILYYFYAAPVLTLFALGHLFFSLLWIFLVERELLAGDTKAFRFFRIILDLLNITVFIYATGGDESFFPIGYSVVVVNSSLETNRENGIFAAAVATVMYAFLMIFLATGILPMMNIFDSSSRRFSILSGILTFIVVILSSSLLHVVVNRMFSNLEKSRIQLKKARDALWSEMELATKIQSVLLPLNPGLPGFDVLGYYRPASEVGGDFYDIIEAKGRHWIVMGDVSGHGVSAGLVMMMILSSLRSLIEQKPEASPAEILNCANLAMFDPIKKLDENKYVTILLFKTTVDGEFDFAGSHQDILVYRTQSVSVESIETPGAWIGAFRDIEKDLRITGLKLNRDDIVLLYSDGLTECMDQNGDLFGEDRLKKVLQENGKLDLPAVRDRILESIRRYRLPDDVTFLLLKRR